MSTGERIFWVWVNLGALTHESSKREAARVGLNVHANIAPPIMRTERVGVVVVRIRGHDCVALVGVANDIGASGIPKFPSHWS